MEYTNSHMEHLIDEYIHSERNRKILKRRLIDGLCYEEIASEFYLSEKQVKNIIYKNESILFSKLEN